MRKYISYTENGKEIKKEYSDQELVNILQRLDKKYRQIAVFNESPLFKDYTLKVILFNAKPAENGAVSVVISDGVMSDENEDKFYQFIHHLEKILSHIFSDKHLYSHKEQMDTILHSIFDMPADVDFRYGKVLHNCMPHKDYENLEFDEAMLFMELQRDIDYLEEINNIRIYIDEGEYSEEYSDYLYAIIVDVNGTYDRCEIIISEFLEKFDGEDKIKKTVFHIAELISIRWPEIELILDTTIKREQN